MSESCEDPGASHTCSHASGRELVDVLAVLVKALKQWMRANIAARSGALTVPRATLLLGLALRSDPVGMSELGEQLGMSPRNMTVLVDGLEKEGMVRRVGHPSDRRIKLVELTDTGRRMAEQELGPAQEAVAAVFDAFTPEERDTLFRLLLKLADSLRERGVEVPPLRQR